MKKGLSLLVCVLFASSLTFIGCSDDDDKTTYTVTYVTEIGTAPSAIKVDEGTVLSAKELPTLARDGYTFAGWYVDTMPDKNTTYTGTQAVIAGSYTVTGDVVLAASWTYTVMLDPNGGTGSSGTFQAALPRSYHYTASSSVSYISNNKIPTASDAGISKSGYTFICWNDSADGKGISFRADETFSDSIRKALWQSETSKTTRLYAVWRESSSTLKVATAKNAESVFAGLNNGDTLIYLGYTPEYTGAENGVSAIETYLKNADRKITLDLSYHSGYLRGKTNKGLFEGCTSIQKVIVSRFYNWDDDSTRVFYKCSNLEEIEFADTVTTIPSYAFSTTAITSVTIPSAVESIGAHAFSSNYFTSMTFEKTSGWRWWKGYGSESININVSDDPTTNATNYKNTWFRGSLYR